MYIYIQIYIYISTSMFISVSTLIFTPLSTSTSTSTTPILLGSTPFVRNGAAEGKSINHRSKWMGFGSGIDLGGLALTQSPGGIHNNESTTSGPRIYTLGVLESRFQSRLHHI